MWRDPACGGGVAGFVLWFPGFSRLSGLYLFSIIVITYFLKKERKMKEVEGLEGVRGLRCGGGATNFPQDEVSTGKPGVGYFPTCSYRLCIVA